MIKIFTGDNRVKASQEIKKLLGENYEVIDCTNLTKRDLPQIFKSSTLFDAHRRILMRDFTANSDICPELINYLNTPHDVILLETKLDKRTAAYKEIKNKLEIKEFKLPPKVDFREVYSIYDLAKRDGKSAVKKLREIELEEDPIRFTGLLVSQALKDYQKNRESKKNKI